MELTITSANFESLVLAADKPVLLDFWAPWCGPCRMIAPVVEQITNDHAGKVVVGKVNVDEEMDLAVRFGISSIPTLLAFKDGKLTASAVGVRSQKDIEAMLF